MIVSRLAPRSIVVSGADLDVVLDDHAADLRHFEMAARPHRETESVLADPHAGMDDDAVADKAQTTVAWAPIDAFAADADLGADHRIGADQRAGADLRAGPDHRAGIDDDARLESRRGMDEGAGRNAGFAERRVAAWPLADRGAPSLRPSRDRAAA